MTEQPAADTIYESVAAVRSPIIREMLAYWESKRVDGRLPRPGDIDPTEIPRLIATIVICDLETNPASEREAGRVITEIGVAVVKPAEFVIFRIQQNTGA